LPGQDPSPRPAVEPESCCLRVWRSTLRQKRCTMCIIGESADVLGHLGWWRKRSVCRHGDHGHVLGNETVWLALATDQP
jgi:hypothetical protein